MWINGIIELFVDAKGRTTLHPPGVHLEPTGWGDEKYYRDDDGNIRHVPPRTRDTHPWNYDPMTLINTGEKATGSAYSDRMSQGNYKQFRLAMQERGELQFDWGDVNEVTQMCQTYYNDPTLQVTKVVHMCNQATGFPVWYIEYVSTKNA